MSVRIIKNLKKLKNFLTPERWAQNSMAQVKLGEKWWVIPVSKADEKCKFCLVGAARYLFGETFDYEDVIMAMHAHLKKTGRDFSVMYANDTAKNVEEVYQIIEGSIELCRQKQ